MKKPFGTQQGVLHGPTKWTKAEFRALLDAAAKMPGEFNRSGGRTVTRAAWWTAYLRTARDTGLPLSILRKVRSGDVTPSGMLVATPYVYPAQEAKPPRGYRLAKATRRAIRPLRGKSRLRLLAIRERYRTVADSFAKLLGIAGLRTVEGYRLCLGNGTRAPQREPAPVVTAKPADSFNVNSTLAEFFEGCYLPLKLGNRSARTAVLYRMSIKKFGTHLGRDAMLGDLTDDNLTAHLAAVTAAGLSPFTAEKERCQISAIWTFAAKRGLLATFPTVPKGRLPERKPLGWMTADLETLFAGVAKLPGYVGAVPAPRWWSALLLVLLDTAERITAVVNVGRSNLDLGNGWITIPAELRKGKTRDMVSKLHPETVAAVMQLMQCGPRSPLVFPWPYSASYLWQRFGKVLEFAGLPSDSRSKFHRLRRTTASYYEREGGNATELLDHDSRKTTRKYLDARIVERKHPCDIIPRPKLGDE